MKKEGCLWWLLLGSFMLSCHSVSEQQQKKALYNDYCGRCHLVPNPSNIPKNIWADHVLPEMASRMGHRYGNNDPLGIYSMEEDFFTPKNEAYPEESMIDHQEWQQIHEFIMDLAPDEMPADPTRKNRHAKLVQFTPHPLFEDQTSLGGIVHIQFDRASSQFLIGDSNGSCLQWPESISTGLQFSSPLLSYLPNDEETYMMEVGILNPSEKALGKLYKLKSGTMDTVASKLHRPVHANVIDLNDDGKDEILICEFGHHSGQLTLLVDSASIMAQRTLLQLPGTIKTEIIDLNGDQLKDIIVLAAQGVEGVFVLYQEPDLQFRLETLIQMGPEYGSSWFELVDYDSDTDLDIILVNGDNGDYSIFPKSYHGLRLFLNNGKNGFEEKWFYPIYGATRVFAEDYDLDGDLDFAVMAFFPDFENAAEEGFVYFENQSSSQFLFETYTFPMAGSGRWLVMENGDYDQDGDIDILMGANPLSPGQENASIAQRWNEHNLKLLLLENKARE